MKNRIHAILDKYQLTAAEFAKNIGINPSGLSHILNGNRNNLSMDSILKILKIYPDLDLEWLILGKGEMFKSENITNNVLFVDSHKETKEKIDKINSTLFPNNELDTMDDSKNLNEKGNSGSSVKKIIIIYDDNSFEELNPK